MGKVSWLGKDQIGFQADDLLNQWEIFTGQPVKPPIPVEAIAEKYLKITLGYDDLNQVFGVSDVLGATWVEEQRMVLNSALLDGPEGRINFTWAHEIGHWVLHRKYLVEKAGRSPAASPAVVCRTSAAKLRGEWQADYFSACLLMPQAYVRMAYEKAFGPEPLRIYNQKSCYGRNNRLALDPSLDTADRIAQRVIAQGNFTNVSQEAMCYRLEELGLLINHSRKPLSAVFQAKELFFLNPEPKIRREHKWQG
jgi:Zn-dependent peptidase ImmA (M78 family)